MRDHQLMAAHSHEEIESELDLEFAIRALDKGYRRGEWTFYAAAAVVPLLAPFIAIVWLAQNRVGPGLAVLLTGWVASSIWFGMLIVIGIANP
jgi:hypothetical protein